MILDRKKRIGIFVILPFILAVQNICSAESSPVYTIVDLGTLGGEMSIAYGINEQGAIAGKSKTADGDLMSFYWDSISGFVEIGLGKALGINDSGEVVGNYHKHTDDAFIWDAENGLLFLNKGEFLFATATAIANSGKTVGYARKFNDVAGTKAILWDPAAGTLSEIGTLGGPSYAYGINNAGEIVGSSGNPSRAFIWNSAEGMKDLGTLDEADWQYYAMDINDSGQVAGYIKKDDGAYRAFIWDQETGMQMLSGDGDGLAYGINRYGHVVGAKNTIIGFEGTAYLWRNGQRIDLNETISSEAGWKLREARDISDSGQICGNGLINGEIHAFMLSPILAVQPDIKANGSDTPVTVSKSEVVSITLGLDPSSNAGLNADWWVAVHTPFGYPEDWYSYVYSTGWMTGINLCIRAPLFELHEFEAFNANLPTGKYIFYFAINFPDGKAVAPWWGIDTVEVNVE